jgi:general secretion pathway protein D
MRSMRGSARSGFPSCGWCSARAFTRWGLVCLLLAVCAFAPHAGQAQQSAPAVTAPAVTAPPAAEPSARQTRTAEKFYLLGVRAMEKGDVDAAEKAFAKASKADPSMREYTMDLQIARQHVVAKLLQDADKARLAGHPEVARAKLAEALALDPKNPEVSRHIDNLASLAATEPPADTVTFAPPIELTPNTSRQSFHIKSSEQEVLRRVLETYGIKALADDSIATRTIRFDADDVDYAQAARLVNLATDSFLVPLDPVRVLVAKDTKENRAKYERMSMETLRLPGLTTVEYTDMGNLAKNVLGVQQATVDPGSGTLTVRAPTGTLVALNKTLADLLDGKSEVLLDGKVYQVDNNRTQVVGVQLPQTTTVFNIPTELNSVIQGNESLVQQIISSGLASAGDFTAIAAILIGSGEVSGSVLSQPFATFGNGLTLSGLAPGGITGNLSLTVSDTRVLDQVQLRLDDNAEGTLRVGTRYPIETSNYSNIAASSVSIPGITSAGLSSILSGLGVNASSLASAQPIPQVQYEDLGLIFKVTPRIERDDDVTLKLDLKIQALQGATLNGLPVLTNQSYTADIRLLNGASALVVGDLSRQESNAVSGTPGLTELPGFSPLSSTTKEYDVSNLAILVTPHILRRRHNQMMGPLIPMPGHS